ncbi:MAG: hypothetical protein ABFE13_06195 [Phycisphaerales bacterium]
MLLNAEQILAAEDKQVRKVPVPEWGQGAKVLVGSMGALDRARLDDWIDSLGRKPKPSGQSESQATDSATEDIVTCDDAPTENEPASPTDDAESQGTAAATVTAVEEFKHASPETWTRLSTLLSEQMTKHGIDPKVIENVIRGLRGLHATESEKEYSSEENTAVMVRWCAACILDPKTRQRAFTDEQIEALGSKSPAALLRVYRAAVEVNLATKQSADAFEKNSVGTSGVDSGGD